MTTYLIQHCTMRAAMECPAGEARFWARFVEYNVYSIGGCILLLPDEILNDLLLGGPK